MAIMNWGERTQERNDFYPWATILNNHQFRLHMSEPDRLFLFPMVLKNSNLWIDGDYTQLRLSLGYGKRTYELYPRFIAELDRTYFSLPNTGKVPYQFNNIFVEGSGKNATNLIFNLE